MRFLAPALLLSCFVLQTAPAQTIVTSSAPPKATQKAAAKAAPEKLPQYRPILLGRGSTSLVNLIDVQELMRKGQKDAAIMFSVSVSKTGEIMWAGTYRGTEGSKPLEEEVQKRLSPASATKFIPGVYDGQAVDAIYYGTVVFAVVDGQPRLRVFSNQEDGELQREADFIGPQPFFGPQSGFKGLHYPPKDAAPVQVDGVAVLTLTIDAQGGLQGIFLAAEEPPFSGFGDAAVRDFTDAKFIPAFRDGKPVAAQIKLPVYYRTDALVRGFWDKKPEGK